MVKAIVFDTEVNSLDSKEVIELAFARIEEGEDFHSKVFEVELERFNPTHPFEAGAVAMHGILPCDVVDCRPSFDATLPDADYYIGHNVDFDMEVMRIIGGRRICTLALSRYLWPEFRNHKLASVYLELKGMTKEAVSDIQNAHSADADVRLTVYILGEIIKKLAGRVKSLADLYAVSEIARIPVVWTFGKHVGTRLDETPKGYIRWMMDQSNVDPYLMKALKALV